MELPVNYEEMHWSKRKLVREEYVRVQKGLCQHCGEPLSGEPSKEVRSKPVNERLFPTGFFKWPVHLHHSHKDGMTIGAVHCHCNAVLWEYNGE